MKTIGICFGSSTMQFVILDGTRESCTIEKSSRFAHEGNPRKVLLDFLASPEIKSVDRIVITGRAFRNTVALSSISEPEAIEAALRFTYKDTFPQIVISSGGETQLVYSLDKNGGINSVHSGNKCASGTGEFFLQQIRRMGLSLEEAVALASKGKAHKIAGRCSVFCKSDCTHALNKGEPRENIAAGLCLMMADKISDLVKDIPAEHAAIIGGGSLNTAMVDILKERFVKLDVPQFSASFEALGAALWAFEHECQALPSTENQIFKARSDSFSYHKPLRDAMHLVDFKQNNRDTVRDGDTCILGLDVGSTTTKAVLLRKQDKALLASIYLRTNGDPIGASRECYKSLKQQVGNAQFSITGLGVTGSGRQIASLHALTESVINEIIAHATAASYFDKDVDTIFEIGGQDAKYTYLTGGVPSDYAMNEACSAGTGSFLEESARESLNIPTEQIGPHALEGNNPPNFTDQCAAFISSDIKTASQEGIETNDILAGLVYSICLNYLNRVKGARPSGKKIFMQGGVCYNKAVPLAMASLMQSKIVVPPDPGLMGAFGVALEVINRIELGITKETHFDLDQLINREAIRDGSFTCAGGKEKCDRKCEISKIRIDGQMYPFGGVCNKYYNMRLRKEVETELFDYVAIRQKLSFEKYGVEPFKGTKDQDKPERTVGIMRSFLTYAYYPLYSNFFKKIGFSVVLPDKIDPEGISRIEAAFCLPAELSHGSFLQLLKQSPDYIFLPHITQIPVANQSSHTKVCVFVQGETYYLQTTFRKEIENSTTNVLAPVLKMNKAYEDVRDAFLEMAKSMGVAESVAQEAFTYACEKQRAYDNELLEWGDKALDYLDKNPDTFGIVLFGRPYNSFTSDANMGIPHKVASRGYIIIPHDMLRTQSYKADMRMYWGMGQKIMKAAQYVKEKENLFGFFITNFSCGPDSFILTFFRNLMGRKPSLTLELDQHTADAGIDTRIEAALDIIGSYRRLSSKINIKEEPFKAAQVQLNGKEFRVISSKGEEFSLTDNRVELLFPSMGRYGTEAVAAIFKGMGIRASALPVADKNVFLTGRKLTTGKECLPYIVTIGSFFDYVNNVKKNKDDVTLFFMATGGGPCRLGQYYRAMEQTIDKNKIQNAAMFTMTDENGYGGLGPRNLLKAYQAVVVSDCFSDIRSYLSVAAQDKDYALGVLEDVWKELLTSFEGKSNLRFTALLTNIARKLREIPLKQKIDDIPVISLVGEIFVRRDEFSRQSITDYLESEGFMVKVAPVHEYLCYSNHVINSGMGDVEQSFKSQITIHLVSHIQEWWERRIKDILSTSGLYKFEMIEIEKTLACSEHLIKPALRGEAGLTVGLSLREILHESCGVVSIGPFGCMPSRVAESVLKREMNMEGKKRLPGWNSHAAQYAELSNFPFLSLETDGSPFPQLIEANMEAFVLQARRIHRHIKNIHRDRYKRAKRHMLFDLYDLVTFNGRNVPQKNVQV